MRARAAPGSAPGHGRLPRRPRGIRVRALGSPAAWPGASTVRLLAGTPAVAGDRGGPVADGRRAWGGTNMGMEARLLLVHSPLVGCGTWEPIAKDLAGDGYAVTVSDLAGAGTGGPPFHLAPAQAIADSGGGQPAVLIGHRGAGPLLATAGMMLGEGVRGYIFVDAGLPPPGRSWLETVPPDPAVRRHFTAGCPRLPLAMLEEIHPSVPGWPNAPGGYLQLSEAYEGRRPGHARCTTRMARLR